MNARPLTWFSAISSQAANSRGRRGFDRPSPRGHEPVRVIAISSAEVFSFHPAAGDRLVCRSGAVWVTQEADPRDHVLTANEERVFATGAKVVVQSVMDRAAVQLLNPIRHR